MAIEGFSIAFDDHYLEPDPVWTRLDGTSGLVARYSIRRGRQDELAKTGTGTATVELNDTQGDFEPTYIDSPYFGKLDGKQAAIALWDPIAEEWVTRFRGFIDSYDFEVAPSGVVTRVSIELVDGLDYLAGAEMALGTAGDSYPPALDGADIFYENAEVDQRIHNLLDDALWPLELRTIFSGNVEIKSNVYPPGTNFLQALSDAADAEFPGVANVYVSADGKVTFHGRLARFSPETVHVDTPWDWHSWKAGDGSIISTDLDYAQIRRLGFARPRKSIINAAMALPDRWLEDELTAAQIAGQIVADPASADEFGVHSWSAENLLTQRMLGDPLGPTNNDLTETKKFASYYVQNYAQPRSRVTSLGFRSIHPEDPRAPAVWALLANVEISDEIVLKTIHPGGGGFEDESFFVEGISYEVEPLGPWYSRADEELKPPIANVTLSLDVTPRAYYTIDPFSPS